jgi:predicted HNH restriction endonuclease
MKKLILSAFAIVVVLSSCSKSDDNTPSEPAPSNTQLTRTEIITSKNWKLTANTLNGQDRFSIKKDCVKDDIFQFKTDGSYIRDEGATKCDPSDPQIIISSTWKFLDNETKLELDGSTTNIKEMTSTKIIFENSNNGNVELNTFTAQ